MKISEKAIIGITAGTVLTGLAAVFYAAATAPSGPGDAPAKDKIWASQDTKNALGWVAPVLPQWAGMPVLIASGQDLKGLAQESVTTRISFNGFSYKEETNSRFSDLRDKRITPFLNNEQFSLDWAAASYNELKTRQGYVHICSISMFPIHYTAQDYASALAFVPIDKEALAGQTAHDWSAMIQGHEAGHCADMHSGALYMMSDLEKEISADQHALDNVYAAYRAGKPFNPATFESWKAVRTIGSFARLCETQRNGIDHATAIALHIPGGTQGDEPAHDTLGRYDLYPVYKEVLKRLGSSPADSEVNEQICTLVHDRPDTLYQTVDAIVKSGAFAPDSLQTRLMSAFLDAAGKYARAYFKLPAPAASPPIPTSP